MRKLYNTSKTDYNGTYKCWQRTSSAKISGITANTVDFDICYKQLTLMCQFISQKNVKYVE